MMKPVVFVSLSLFCIVYAGNACMKGGFTVQSTADSGIRYASCAADESSLNKDIFRDTRDGYIGQRRVNYVPFGEDAVMIEGDMLMHAEGGELPARPLPAGISHGVGVKGSQRWPGGRIPYRVPVGFPEKYRIDEAISAWNENLKGVIQFVPWQGEAQYASIGNASAGCASFVGYLGRGAHDVNIDSICSTGNVIHELGHVLGLQHEQNRLDRDQFVTIHRSKIQPGYETNFETDPGRFQNYLEYNFGSIMHYAYDAFSVDGNSRTITPKVSVPADVEVGQRKVLTLGDVNSVRAMYGGALSAGPVIPPVRVENTGLTGVAAAYFQRRDFNDMKVSQLETSINFDWGLNPPVDKIVGNSFSAKFRAYLVPPTTGDYAFRITSSGAFKLVADGATIFNQPMNAEKNEFVSRFYTLPAASRMEIVLDYQSMGGENSLKLEWIKPNGTEEVISDALFADQARVSELQSLCSFSDASQ